MGACDISFTLEGKKTKEEVKKRFRQQQQEDADYNGHQDGYSGDFQTVGSIKFIDKTFNSYNEAYNFCMNNAEKWNYVVAVKYKKGETKISSTTKKLKESLNNTQEAIQNLNSKSFKDLKQAKSKTIGCKHCDSKINRTYLRTIQCPVCHKDLRSETIQKRLANLKSKKIVLEKRLKDAHKKEVEKGAAKAKNSNWLVAGLGAC